MPTETVFIGIGSNLGEPLDFVKQAIASIRQMRQSQFGQQSSLYRTAPLGDTPQDDYINAVVSIETSLQPTELLLELQAIEQAFYRQRDPDNPWGPRTMDLDIILFGNRKINDSHLTVPHPRFSERLFVLQPMLEIAGDFYISGYGSLSYLLKEAPELRLEKLNS